MPDPFSGQDGSPVVIWSGTFDWRPDHAVIAVPPKAVRAVLQVEKLDANGSVRIDRVAATAAPDPAAGAWVPYHVEDDTSGWVPGAHLRRRSRRSRRSTPRTCSTPRRASTGSSPSATAGSASRKGGRARFFGVYLLPPTAVPRAEGGRRPGRSPGAVGHQPGPARRPRHAARPRSQPLRRQPRRHQGVRPDRPGQARPPDRRLEGPGHLHRAGAPERPEVPFGGRRRRRRATAAGRRAGRRLRLDPRPARAGGRRGPCSSTSTPRRAWRSATIRCWPG